MKFLRGCQVFLAAVSVAVFPTPGAEYLPVCEKCLNPRVLSKSGIGSSAAVAEAKVVAEDAAAWCAANRPRDKYCSTEELKNGGDGGRKSYKASADCPAGVLHSIDGYDYFYNGVWPDGAGRGRPRLKDAGNNVRQWNSIVSGRGISRSEWDRYGGYSMTGQWEVLCGATAPAMKGQAVSPGSSARESVAPSKAPASVSQAAAGGGSASREWLASCFRCPAPTVVSKAGIGTAHAVAEARMTAEEIRSSCSEADPRNVEACVRREMAEVGKKLYRATADCTAGRITTIDEQQYTLAGVWDNRDIGGGRTQWRGADGQIVGRDNASGGLAISQQWELLCPGPVTASLLAQAARPQQRIPPAATSAPGGSGGVPVCTGKRYCDEVPSFAAIVRDFRTSAMPDSTRMVSATVRFLNKTSRPLILGYLRNAAVAIDDQGNRYVLAGPASVRGIGEIAGRDFDPKFTVQPGQTADARFEFVWRPNGREIIGQRAWDVELAVREVSEVGVGQYRFGQEHTVEFKSVPPAQMTSGVSGQVRDTGLSSDAIAAGGPATVSQNGVSGTTVAPATPQADHCAGKRGCHDSGAFVAEVRNAMLTREGNMQDRVARIDLQIRNTSSQPISLAYVAKSSVLVDNLGNRFFWGTAGTYDTSVTGMGKVEGNKADPQFTLGPGESRNATFTLRRRAARTAPDGTGYTYNVSLAQLEVLSNGQQIRTTREHALLFTDFGMSLPGAGASAPGASPQPSLRDLGTAIRRGLERKK